MITISGIGRLGREPKMQYSASGTAITNISLAADCGFGDKKETVWVSLVSFSTQAEALNKYLDKGSRLAFTAEVTKINPYTKKDGTLSATLDARVLTFAFVDKADAGGAVEEEPEVF